jgi:hypothetical protein
MDFIDYAVFYYLSEQDQQNFLNSLSFFDRQNYQNNYDQWFYDPNNPITNIIRTDSLIININYCVNSNLNNISFTYSINPNDPSARQNAIDQATSNYRNGNIPYTVGVNSPAPLLTCFTPDFGNLGGIGEIVQSTTSTVYITYCNGTTPIFSRDTITYTDLNDRSVKIRGIQRSLEDLDFTEVSVTLSPASPSSCVPLIPPPEGPTGPGPSPEGPTGPVGPSTVTLYASFCGPQGPRTSSFGQVNVQFRDSIAATYKAQLERNGNTSVVTDFDSIPPLPTNCPSTSGGGGPLPPSPPSNITLSEELRASGCLNGAVRRTFKRIEIEAASGTTKTSEFFRDFLSSQTVLFRNQLLTEGYTKLSPITTSPNLPQDSDCTTAENNNTTSAIPQVLAAVQFQECDGSIVNLSNSIAPPAPSVNINGIGISLDTINKGILGDFAYTYKTATSTVFSKPGTYTVTFGSISGWKTPSPVTFNLNSVNEYGGGNAGAGIYVKSNCNETTTIAQIQASVQFQECDGTIVQLRNSNRPPAPSLTINGKNLPLDRFGPTTYESFILGDNAYIYRELTSLIYSTPGTYTVNFGDVPGWVTPNPASFTLNSNKESKGGNEAVRMYKRPGCDGDGGGTTGGETPPGPGPTGPGPTGPGPTGPGPTPPPAPPPPPPTTTTTTTLRIPDSNWLKRINPIDNRKYVFDITEGLFSNNVRNLVTFFTGSTSENYSRYYTHVYDENPKTSLTSSIQFSIAYGHSGGSGSLDEGNKINITPTRAIYSQYRNLVLGRPDVKFNLTGKETDSIYVINYQSKRLKDRLDAGVLELNIAHLSGSRFLAGGGTRATHTGSNVKLAGTNRVLRLIDDSKININPDYTDVGYSYNIVSGTLETGVYNESNPHYYGKLIPSLGIVFLDGNKLDLSASFATSNASEIEGYNAIKLYKSFSGSALIQDISGDYLGMKARRIIREYNDYYFIRINNREFNFTNNNSYFIYNKKETSRRPGDLSMPLDPNSPEGMELAKRLTETNGEIFPNFVNNPQVYITTVGLYNAQRELVAVGKLAKPILKNFTEESIFTVKLKY